MSKSKQNLTEKEIRAIVRDELGEDASEQRDEPTSTRRNFVKGAGVAAALGLVGSGTAAGQTAEPGAACTWRGDQNAAGYSLYGVGNIEFKKDDGTTVQQSPETLWEDSNGDGLLSPAGGSKTGIDVADVDGDSGTFNSGLDVTGTTTTDALETEAGDIDDLASVSPITVGGQTEVPISLSNPRTVAFQSVNPVIGPSDVSVGFTNHHPKEPAAFYQNGTYYVLCAVWDDDGPVSEVTTKEVVLLGSKEPDGGFTQLSQVTSNAGVFDHAPALHIEGGTIYAFWTSYSDDAIHLKTCSLNNIPSNASGWTDQGAVITGSKDPGLHKGPDGTYYMFTNQLGRGEPTYATYRFESTDLTTWTNRTKVFEAPSGSGYYEASEVIPKYEDGFYLFHATAEVPGRGWGINVAEANTLDGQFTNSRFVTPGHNLVGLQRSENDNWNSHLDVVKTDASTDVLRVNGEVQAYLEIRDQGDTSANETQFRVAHTSIRDSRSSSFRVPTRGARSILPMLEGEGETLHDVTGSHATLTGGNVWFTGDFGEGIVFDGTVDSRVELDIDPSIDGAVTSMIVPNFESISVSSTGYIASSGYDGSTASWQWKHSEFGPLKFESFQGGANGVSISTSFEFDPDIPNVLFGVYRPSLSQWEGWINGRMVTASSNSTGAVPVSGTTPALGAHYDNGSFGFPWGQKLEIFGLWDCALGKAEIQTISESVLNRLG